MSNSRLADSRITPFVCIAFALHAATASAQSTDIPLCKGLTIVTSVQQSSGDYESIKRITDVTPEVVTLHYSTERLVSDFLSSDPAQLVRTELDRTVRQQDLESAFLYLQQFDAVLPELVPETTAIGTSKEVLRKLKADEEVDLGVFIAFSGIPTINRDEHPNVYDNQMVTRIRKYSPEPVPVTVIVDDQPTALPALHVGGNFFGDAVELWFLDNEENPLTLRYRFGVDSESVTPEMAKLLGIEEQPPSDRERFDVIKISTRCGDDAGDGAGMSGGGDDAGDGAGMGGGGGGDGAGDGMGAAGAGTGGGGGAGQGGGADDSAVESLADAVENQLMEDGVADIHSIYFGFGSAELRPESDIALKAVAAILQRQPDWTVTINGHTDSIADNTANQRLSEERAEAVRNALIGRFAIDAGRLKSAGYGEGRPVADNETVEGRALNRRVEIVRAP